MGLSRKLRIPPSRLLMPLAFASLMGGTCTLIGTSTNVAVSGAITKLGLQPLRMFEFTAIGIVLMITGILYMVFIGSRLVPERDSAAVLAVGEPKIIQLSGSGPCTPAGAGVKPGYEAAAA